MLWLDLSHCKVFEDRLIITEGLSSSTTVSAGTLRPLRFAFPMHTLVIEGPPQEDLPVARGALGALLGRR